MKCINDNLNMKYINHLNGYETILDSRVDPLSRFVSRFRYVSAGIPSIKFAKALDQFDSLMSTSFDAN